MNHDIQVRTPEDAELIRKQRFGLFIALALAREQHELWERMQVSADGVLVLFLDTWHGVNYKVEQWCTPFPTYHFYHVCLFVCEGKAQSDRGIDDEDSAGSAGSMCGAAVYF